LVGVGVPGQVGVGCDLPSGEVDGLQAGADLLDSLVTGERTEGVDVVLSVEQLPQAFCSQTGQRVLLGDRAAQPDHILSGVRPLDALPARVGLPLLLESRAGFLLTTGDAHGLPALTSLIPW